MEAPEAEKSARQMAVLFSSVKRSPQIACLEPGVNHALAGHILLLELLVARC